MGESESGLCGSGELRYDDRRDMGANQHPCQCVKWFGSQLRRIAGMEHNEPHAAVVEQDADLSCIVRHGIAGLVFQVYVAAAVIVREPAPPDEVPDVKSLACEALELAHSEVWLD